LIFLLAREAVEPFQSAIIENEEGREGGRERERERGGGGRGRRGKGRKMLRKEGRKGRLRCGNQDGKGRMEESGKRFDRSRTEDRVNSRKVKQEIVCVTFVG